MKTICVCMFCGHEAEVKGGTTLEAGDGRRVAETHVRVCESHPMREVERAARQLAAAAQGLIGYHDAPCERDCEDFCQTHQCGEPAATLVAAREALARWKELKQ